MTVLAASLTPLAPDGAIDTGRLARHAARLLDGGCDGVLLFGTTGEAVSFSVDARRAALEAVVDAGTDPAHLVVGTGCCAGADTAALSRHALATGARGVLVMPPFLYPHRTLGGPATDDGVAAAFEALAEATAGVASEPHVYLYHYPRMSRVPFAHALIARLTQTLPGVVAGIKDSTGDRAHTLGLVATFPELDVFAGTEALLADVVDAGGAGCMSATVNVTHRLARALLSAQGGVRADRQAHLAALRRALGAYPLIPALKQVVAWQTGDAAWRAVRPPLTPLAAADAASLRVHLEALTLLP
jgi:4-hydroxy-tetrahydrodipicolinate synthase